MDPTAIITSLARIEAQNESMSETLSEIKKNLTMGDGSTLRDSVNREIMHSMKEQKKECGRDVVAVANSVADEAIRAHEKDFHRKRDSVAPVKSAGFSWSKWAPVASFLFKRVLPVVVAGGLSIGGYEILKPSKTAVESQPVSDIDKGDNNDR